MRVDTAARYKSDPRRGGCGVSRTATETAAGASEQREDRGERERADGQ
ncbi:hypothetical protein [Haloferax volcanii]|nr:hypothetical protein [Haloferax volcanii]